MTPAARTREISRHEMIEVSSWPEPSFGGRIRGGGGSNRRSKTPKRVTSSTVFTYGPDQDPPYRGCKPPVLDTASVCLNPMSHENVKYDWSTGDRWGVAPSPDLSGRHRKPPERQVTTTWKATTCQIKTHMVTATSETAKVHASLTARTTGAATATATLMVEKIVTCKTCVDISTILSGVTDPSDAMTSQEHLPTATLAAFHPDPAG